MRNPEHAIDHYVAECILKKGLISPTHSIGSESKPQYDAWFEEIDCFDIKELLDSNKSMIKSIFNKYCRNAPELGDVIPIDKFIVFCKAVSIIPELMSTPECTKVIFYKEDLGF